MDTKHAENAGELVQAIVVGDPERLLAAVEAVRSTALECFLRDLFACRAVESQVQEQVREQVQEQVEYVEEYKEGDPKYIKLYGISFWIRNPILAPSADSTWWLIELCWQILNANTKTPGRLDRLQKELFGAAGPRDAGILIELMRVVLILYPRPCDREETGTLCAICDISRNGRSYATFGNRRYEGCAYLFRDGFTALNAHSNAEHLGPLNNLWYVRARVIRALADDTQYNGDPCAALFALETINKVIEAPEPFAATRRYCTDAFAQVLESLYHILGCSDLPNSILLNSAMVRILGGPLAQETPKIAQLAAAFLMHPLTCLATNITPGMVACPSRLVDALLCSLESAMAEPTGAFMRAHNGARENAWVHDLSQLAHYVYALNLSLDEPRKIDLARLTGGGRVLAVVELLKQVDGAIAVAMIPWREQKVRLPQPDAYTPAQVRTICGALLAALEVLARTPSELVAVEDVRIATEFLNGTLIGRPLDARVRDGFMLRLLDALACADDVRPMLDPLAFIAALRDIHDALEHSFIRELIGLGVDLHLGSHSEVIDLRSRFGAMGYLHVPAMPGGKLCLTGYVPGSSDFEDPTFSGSDSPADDDRYFPPVIDETAADAYRKEQERLDVSLPEQLEDESKCIKKFIATEIGRLPPFNHVRGVGCPLDVIDMCPVTHLMQSGCGYGALFMPFLGRAEHRALAAVGRTSLLAVRRQYGHRGCEYSLGLLPPR